MDKETAYNLIKETFKNPFNEEKFTSSSFNDNDWDTTNFPSSFERIFNRQKIDGAVWFRKKI